MREIGRKKRLQWRSGCATTIVWDDRWDIACVWVCVHVCRGHGGAMGSIVKRTIGVKLG